MQYKNQLIIFILSLHLVVWTAIVYYVLFISDFVSLEENIKYIIFSVVFIWDFIAFILTRKMLNKKTI
jgi:hypothetical protein